MSAYLYSMSYKLSPFFYKNLKYSRFEFMKIMPSYCFLAVFWSSETTMSSLQETKKYTYSLTNFSFFWPGAFIYCLSHETDVQTINCINCDPNNRVETPKSSIKLCFTIFYKTAIVTSIVVSWAKRFSLNYFKKFPL